MKKYFWKGHQNLSQFENGRDILIEEIRFNYKQLLEEMNQLLNEINESILKNDYVKLRIFVERRKQLHVVINAIESLYKEDLHTSGNSSFFTENLKHEKIILQQFRKVSSKFTLHFINTFMKTLHLTGKE